MKTYIQVGTNIGDDEFQEMCSRLNEKSKIILIEPHDKLNDVIYKNYVSIIKNNEVVVINKAIVPKEEIKTVELYFINSKENFSSVINRKSFDLPTKMIVESITLNSLLKELNVHEVEELHIDTEGLDYEILLSLDLNNIIFKTVTCEFWPYDDDENSIYRTGPSIMSEVKNKFSNYEITNTVIGGMRSLMFKKK